MDPQQLRGQTADATSDQYAFCVSMYESLFGQRPFVGSTVTELFRSMIRRKEEALVFPSRTVPKSVLALLRRGLSYEREDRYPSFEALLAALEDARRPSQARWPRWAIPAVGVAAIGGLAFSMQGGRGETPATITAAQAEIDPRAAVVAQTDLPDPVETALPEDPMGATVHRLDNGLTVYLVPRPKDPTVRVQVVVRAGPSEEPDETTGLADWMTVMLGMGTKRLGVRDPEAEAPLLAAQHEALLALNEANTPEERVALLQRAHEAHRQSLPTLSTRDDNYVAKALGLLHATKRIELGTTFESELPASALEGWLTVEAEQLIRPAFRGAVMAAAEVLDSFPWRFAHSRTALTLMGRTAAAYGRWRDLDADYASIQGTPFAALRRFHETYYRPNNTAVILVGNFSTDSILPVIEKAFGAWEPAEVPAPAILRDGPLPDAGKLIELEAPAREAVWVGFSLPPANDGSRPKLEALASILSGPRGLFEGSLAHDPGNPRFDQPWVMLDGRMLALVAAPREGVPPEEVHAAIVAALRRVAEGDVDADAWELAAARWPLDAADWDHSRDALTERIAESFLLHREWHDVVRGHSGASWSRAELEATAAAVLERDHVAMHVRPGAAWTPHTAGLPIDERVLLPDEAALPSPFAKSIAAAPRAVVEPQFLTEGMHFRTTRWGDASVVTHEAEGSLFWVDLEFPVGVRDDPFLCDAMWTRAALWSQLVEMAQLELDLWCAPDSTTIALSGVASAFDASWAELWRRIDETALPEDVIRREVDATLRERAHGRTVPRLLVAGAGEYAAHGRRGLAHFMPTDEALRSATAGQFEESLRRLAASTPDIAYAGPEPDRLLASLPPPRGQRAEPPSEATKVSEQPPLPDRPTVYVIDVPGLERAEAHLFVDWARATPREALLADLYFAQPGPAFDSTLGKDVTAFFAPTDGVNGIEPTSYVWAFEAQHADIVDLIVRATDAYTEGPPAKDYERARTEVESAYRNDRFTRIEIPRYVLTWTEPVDPRLAQWSELGRVTPEVFADYAKRQGTRPLNVTLVCDLSRVDLRPLEKVGRVVTLSPEDAVRNTRERR